MKYPPKSKNKSLCHAVCFFDFGGYFDVKYNTTPHAFKPIKIITKSKSVP